MFLNEYHKGLEVLHFGMQKPRAYYIPFTERSTALNGQREHSERFTLLSGEWKFKYFKSFEDLNKDAVSNELDITDFDDITVPRCWQTYTSRDYDKPLYSNLEYPFPTDPPHVPNENPCGIYYKDIVINKSGNKYYINFEGVSSCFYLFVNGIFTGYSQVSHSTGEFDITGKLSDGKNRISVIVVKWCDGSYLEDQDFFRLSGIFRDVYLLERSINHAGDISIKTNLNDDFSHCDIELAAENALNAKYELIDINGLVVAGEDFDRNTVISLDNPILWNSEQPYLYTLLVFCSGEVIPFRIGIKKVEIKDKKFLINGKREILRGVNRHDNDPFTGYYVSLEDMKRDLFLIKRANCNTIRTSHYPNDPRFYELCTELGIYTVNEADIETHGMGYEVEGEWDWVRWSSLSTLPEWKAAYVDRAKLLYERDKNSPCVVMWSLGNESGVGVNHRAMAQYIRGRDKNAIIHYENSHKEFKVIPEGEDFSDISDVESRMYAGVNYINEYLNDAKNQKPFFMCEYVCSMSTGDVYDYFKFADEYENFCGGCIWEFSDHSIGVKEADGKVRYYYGGDFGDQPNNGICCIDGLVYPDRRLRPGYYDMKKVYEPFRGSFSDGVLTVTNRRRFTPLDDLYAKWTVTSNGKILNNGTIPSVDIAPESTGKFNLFSEDYREYKNCLLTVSFKQRRSTAWADKDYEVGFLQFELGKADFSLANNTDGSVSYDDGDRFITASANGTEIIFDKAYGKLISFKKDGKDILKSCAEFDIWRSPTYNGGSKDRWYLERFERIKQNTYSCTVTEKNDKTVVINAVLSLGAHSAPPVIRMNATWTLLSDGSLCIECNGKVRENAPLLPHLGIKFIMPFNYENVEYFGYGDRETYPDRYKAFKLGEYRTTVTDMYEHYIRPQECGNRFGVRYASVESTDGTGIRFTSLNGNPFCFKALHFDANELINASHDFELPNSDKTVLNIDWKVDAVSENSELDIPKFSRNLGDKEFNFGFKIIPFAKDSRK